ncbi:bifunctional diguanylate cyclase/phosphodiesterase [Demequina sp. NBRC 110053]|uniref:putative bifunctional diguanylate cyclase/phosphodiesterase n=1 Tax=Demequina sp. NBRC 110053 TaxID=1570342 RepID=UPI000A01210C|nr:EAL domain-containing protein [Demequina sp. NBRC 110053]
MRGEGHAARRALTSPSPLTTYAAAVGVVGAAVLAAVLVATDWSETAGAISLAPTLVLVVGAFVGELRPITFVRGGVDSRTLSTSAPFILALIPIAGLAVAIVVQLLASLIDDARLRRAPLKVAFNSGQYVLAVGVAGLTFAALAGVPVAGPPVAIVPSDLPALLLGGVAMIAANWLLVVVVASLSTGVPFRTLVKDDLHVFVVTNLVLLSVGGIAAEVASDGAWTLLLLAPPVVAAHIFAATAARNAWEATHDGLTGLANRTLLHFELEAALSPGRQRDSDDVGLVLIDLDHFKDFNDTLGHPLGDRILCQVAERLVAASPPGATVHRLGGDEFAVVMHAGEAPVRAAAERLIGSFEQPMAIGRLELVVRASAGIAVAPQHGVSSDALMKNADIALYHAKVERDRISMFAPEFDVNTLDRLQLLADLRAAVNVGELSVVYQPQVDLRSGRVVALEALVRWKHHERGLVEPDEFIPLAENSGLIFSLTEFVLDAALRDLRGWREAGHDVRVSVNLSARHLSDLGLPTSVARLMSRHDIPAGALVLEVTETGIFTDPVRADLVLRALRANGVEIAIDDYGTGNASLSYLRSLKIDELKVDRSFVTNIGSDDHDRIIVRSTIELALALDLRVVAEGVEDAPTAEALQALGGVIAQGYHLGAPVPAGQIAARLSGTARQPSGSRLGRS